MLLRRGLTALLTAAPLALAGDAALAGEWDFSASLTGEFRAFPYNAAFREQGDATISPSVSFESEVVYEWNGGDDRLTFVPFLRWDADDDNRTHGDLREANWLHQADDWDLVVGVDKVFWGVTESRHLVNIINQDDAVEDIDGEDKLGQPMINLNLLRDWGTASVYVLPGFRERTFPDDDARLRGPRPIDDDNPTYDSGAEDRHVDLAVRWAHTIEDWDIGLAHFHGTSREPRLIPRIDASGRTVLVPQYDQIDQTSLDLQLTTDAWLWKLEALVREGQGSTFGAAVAGFEYTFYQVAESAADVGLLAEYLHDGRGRAAPPTAFDRDVFVGSRLALNDAQDTQVLLGAVVDLDDGSIVGLLEAERRVGDNYRIELESRFFVSIDATNTLAAFEDDSFVTLRISRYF